MSENKFVKAYNDLMANLYEIMDDGLHSLADALDKAKEKTSEIGGVTQEEIHKIADYVQRDVQGAAHSLNKPENDDLSAWLNFDVDLIENFALDSFLSVADKTKVELADFSLHAQNNLYLSGEITGPGTFECKDCGKTIAFKSTHEIPDCPACGSKSYTRC